MACLLTIHRLMLHTLPMRMSTTLHPYPLRANNPNLIMHMSLNPWGETHEAPRDHNLAGFEPHLEYATEGQAVWGVPLPDTLEGPQFHPQPQPLHFAVGRVPPAMVERGKFDHIEERLRDIEGG